MGQILKETRTHLHTATDNQVKKQVIKPTKITEGNLYQQQNHTYHPNPFQRHRQQQRYPNTNYRGYGWRNRQGNDASTYHAYGRFNDYHDTYYPRYQY
jgi:hypothetical protein